MITMNSEVCNEGEKSSCLDTVSTQSNAMPINAKETVTVTKSTMKEASFVQIQMQMVMQLLDHISILWVIHQVHGVHHFCPNSQSNETITKCGNEMEVASEQDKLSSWGTPSSINRANTSSLCKYWKFSWILFITSVIIAFKSTSMEIKRTQLEKC